MRISDWSSDVCSSDLVGTVGHVTMLRRTKDGPFDLSQAISLDKLNAFGQGAAQSEVFLPLEAGLVDIPALNLSPEAAGANRQGRVWTGVRSEERRVGKEGVQYVERTGVAV